MFRTLLLIFCVSFAVTNTAQAQFYKSVLPSAEFNKELEKIVRDFKYNFKNIAGATLSTDGEYDAFQSTVVLPGSTNCTIYKYHSVIDTTASWQGVLYEGDDYKEAVKAYRNAFKLINRSRMILVDKSIATFAGEYEEPSENLRFAQSTLKLDIADRRYQRFAADLQLVNSYTGWQVSINFASKKPDDERQ